MAGSESFMVSRIGAGVKIPRGASAPNWSFRLDYHLMFINANDDAPAFFARDKTRDGSSGAVRNSIFVQEIAARVLGIGRNVRHSW